MPPPVVPGPSRIGSGDCREACARRSHVSEHLNERRGADLERLLRVEAYVVLSGRGGYRTQMRNSGRVRRKVIQDYANKVCEIFAGWRLAVHENDIPRLIAIGSDELHANLLDGTVRVDGAEIEPLGIVLEIQAWLRDRCSEDNVPIDGLREAELTVTFVATQSRRRGRSARSLRFECSSRLATDERSYEGASVKDELWLGGVRGAPWVVTDQA